MAHQLLREVSNGHTNAVRQLLNQGVPVNSRNGDGLTALVYAVRKGNTNMVRLLLERGANVNARTRPGGMTTLIHAMTRGHDHLVPILIKAGANVNARLRHNNNNNNNNNNNTVFSPLAIAIRRKKISLIRALLNAGAKVNKNTLNNAERYGIPRNTVARYMGESKMRQRVPRRILLAHRVRKTRARAPAKNLAETVFHPRRVAKMINTYGMNWMNKV